MVDVQTALVVVHVAVVIPRTSNGGFLHWVVYRLQFLSISRHAVNTDVLQ